MAPPRMGISFQESYKLNSLELLFTQTMEDGLQTEHTFYKHRLWRKVPFSSRDMGMGPPSLSPPPVCVFVHIQTFTIR